MNTRVKSLLVLALAFSAGVVSGGTLLRYTADCREAVPSPPGPEGAIRHLTELLRLTPDQQKHVREIFVRHQKEMEKEIVRARSFRTAFLTTHFREMDPVLTPEQRIAARKELDRLINMPFPPPPPPPLPSSE